MNTNDPRYYLIKNAARKFLDTRFDRIPNVLFEKLVEQGMEHNDVLELVDSKYRECNECGETNVSIGEELDDGEHGWHCPDCKTTFDADEHEPWERLNVVGPTYGWPGAHCVSFWTDWNAVGQVAAQCGFEVYESPMFGGYVLSIDGGGYDFVDAHWVPLYLAMGLLWHENDEAWEATCEEAENLNNA